MGSPRDIYIFIVVSHIQRIGCQPEKTTLHGGQSRSWSAEQEKRTKKKSGSAPLPPLPTITRRIYRLYAGFGPSRVRTRIPSPRRLGQGFCFARFYASSMCDNKFPSLLASLFSWRCLAASTSCFLHVLRRYILNGWITTVFESQTSPPVLPQTSLRTWLGSYVRSRKVARCSIVVR